MLKKIKLNYIMFEILHSYPYLMYIKHQQYQTMHIVSLCEEQHKIFICISLFVYVSRFHFRIRNARFEAKYIKLNLYDIKGLFFHSMEKIIWSNGIQTKAYARLHFTTLALAAVFLNRLAIQVQKFM